MLDCKITEQAIGLILTKISVRRGEAARIAKAAEACALAGNAAEGARFSMYL